MPYKPLHCCLYRCSFLFLCADLFGVFPSSPSNYAFASCRSLVSNPSVNQLYTSNNILCASSRLPCCCHKRARLIVARSSSDFACCWRATLMALRKQASASNCGLGHVDCG